MSLALFNAVPAGAIEILYDEQNQPWFKQVHVGEYISIANMRDATSKLDPEDKKSRAEINVGSTDGSYTPPKHAKPHDDFLSVNGVTTILLNSRKPKARKVAAWLIRDIIPRGFNVIITEKQQTIEDKDNALALLNDELDETQRNCIMLETDNEQLQRQNETLQRRTVPRIGKHDNILCAIQKNEPDELGKQGDHPYYMIRCQRMRLQERLHIKELQYPNMVIKRPTYDAANAVICWVEFQKYIGKDSYYRNHFSLDNDDHRDFFANTFDIDM